MKDTSRRRESGQSTVLVALFLCFLAIGFMAIGTDFANLFYAKRQVQAAADAAALAAAQKDYANNGGNMDALTPDLYTAANQAMANNQIDPYATQYAALVKLNNPPSKGVYSTGTNANNYIEAVVSKPFSTFFLSYFNSAWAHITITARAVAGTSTTSPQCMCTLSTSGDDLNVSNSGSVAFAGCAATVDSSSPNAVTDQGSGSISGESLNIASTKWTESSNVGNGGNISVTHLSTGASSCSAKSIVAPTYSNCVADPQAGKGGSLVYSLGPSSASGTVCYSGGLTIGANTDVVTLNPGIYVINGGTLEFKSGANGWSNLGGQGVFFYLTNGATLNIDNGANVNLTAMSSGTYKGIVFYQDPADSNEITLGGGASSVIDGDIIAPSATLTDGNYESMTIDSDIVVNKFVSTGSGSLTLKPNTITGGATPLPPRLVE